jgi:hypothetical protein
MYEIDCASLIALMARLKIALPACSSALDVEAAEAAEGFPAGCAEPASGSPPLS